MLQDASAVDSDTLYFIYDDDKATGELYLGNRLISGGSAQINGATYLSDLKDILLSEELNTDDCLIYDITKQKWVNKPIMSVIDTFIGANSTSVGLPGLVPAAPAAGATGLFLRSDGNWVEIVATSEVAIKQILVATGESHTEAIKRGFIDTPHKGDLVVLQDFICDTNVYQNTTYGYDGEKWIAFDGKYDIENIYLSNDLTITANIGAQTLDEGESFKILSTKGKNLKQVLDMLVASRKLPEYKLPSLTVLCPEAKKYEVGTLVSPSFTTVFNCGEYEFAPGKNTEITPLTWKATLENEEIFAHSGIFSSISITDNYKERIAVSVSYTEGVAPKDNLENDIIDSEELLQCQIPAGTAINYSSYISGYRNIFFGSSIDYIDLNSDSIRQLTKKIEGKDSFDINIVEGANQIIIALPSGYDLAVVADNNAFGTDIFSKFNKQIISVAGASEGFDMDYKVYTYTPSASLSENTYTISIV